MIEVKRYSVQICGQPDEAVLNTSSPHEITVESVTNNISELIVTTDQSGIIGVLRLLHGLGFAIISVQIKPSFIK